MIPKLWVFHHFIVSSLHQFFNGLVEGKIYWVKGKIYEIYENRRQYVSIGKPSMGLGHGP